jgi:hypothetical protein
MLGAAGLPGNRRKKYKSETLGNQFKPLETFDEIQRQTGLCGSVRSAKDCVIQRQPQAVINKVLGRCKPARPEALQGAK